MLPFLQTVFIQEIDLSDETYCLSYAFSLDLLKKSIEKVRLVNPPILQKIFPNRYRIVCGRKRVLALHELGYEQFVANLLSEEVSEKDAFLLNLFENLPQRRLNPVEIALALSKLTRYFAWEEISEKFMPLFSLGKSKAIFETYLAILDLEDEIKKGLASEIITREIVVPLLRFSAEERLLFSRMITSLKLSKSKQIELLENCTVLKGRDGININSLLNSDKVKEILSNTKLGLVSQGNYLREYIRKLRYPRLTNAYENFCKQKEKLKLRGIELIPPPYFEGEEYKLSFSIRNLEELKKRLNQLQEVAEKEEFKELFRI